MSEECYRKFLFQIKREQRGSGIDFHSEVLLTLFRVGWIVLWRSITMLIWQRLRGVEVGYIVCTLLNLISALLMSEFIFDKAKKGSGKRW